MLDIFGAWVPHSEVGDIFTSHQWTDKQSFLCIAQNTAWQPLQSPSIHSIYTWLKTAVILLSIVKLHNVNEFNSCLISKTDKTDLWYKLKKNTYSGKFPVRVLKSFCRWIYFRTTHRHSVDQSLKNSSLKHL